jgi:hypothetical protein
MYYVDIDMGYGVKRLDGSNHTNLEYPETYYPYPKHDPHPHVTEVHILEPDTNPRAPRTPNPTISEPGILDPYILHPTSL